MAFPPHLSKKRADKLQEFCKEQSLSALVFILGLDSKRNRFDEKLFYWLFKGYSGSERLNSVSLPLSYEETAWIVTPHSFHIFVGSACNNLKDTHNIYQELKTVSASWQGTELYGITDEEIMSSEIAEETKVLWFVRRMKAIKGPIGFGGSSVESWPLVQAYAIDLFGEGFFSKTHEPVDVSGMLEGVFSEFDNCALNTLIEEHLPRLERNFDQIAEFLNKRNYPSGRSELTQEQLDETVTFPYEYVMIKSNKNHFIKPYGVFWGDFEEERKVGKATHANLVGVCGVTGMCCARTWFLIPEETIKEFVQEEPRSEQHKLLEFYKAIANSLRKNLSTDPSEFKENFLLELFKDKVVLNNKHLLDSARYHLQVTFCSFDADGISHDFDPERFPLHSVLVTVEDIPGPDHEFLGKLTFGETFINLENQVLNITQNIELAGIWERSMAKQPKSVSEHQLSIFENSQMYSPCIGKFTGRLFVYPEAFEFRSIRLNQLVFKLSDFKRIEQHEANQISFFTKDSQITFTLTPRAITFLLSVWRVEISHSPPPYIPQAASISLPKAEEATAESSEKLPVFLVVGTVGSGKAKLGECLAKALGGSIISPPLEDSGVFREDFWRNELSKGHSKGVVAVLPGFHMPSCILGILPSNMYVKNVIVKVYGNCIYENDRKEFLPVLLDQIKVANVMVYEEASNEPEDLGKFFKLCNPSLEIFRMKTTLGNQQAKTILNYSYAQKLSVPHFPVFPLQSCFIHCNVKLVEAKLRQKLLNMDKGDSGTLPDRLKWEREPQILAVKGSVPIKDKEGLFSINGNTQELVCRPSDSTESGVLFIGRNLEPNKLCDFVLGCRSQTSKMFLRTRETVTPEEERLIQEKLPPSEDFFYDGTYYIDEDGKKYLKRPDLEEHILDFVDEENDRIGSFNRNLEKENSLMKKQNSQARVFDVMNS